MGLYQILDVKQEVKFYLANPNLSTIHEFTDVNNRKLTVKYDDIHELSFSIPYKIDVDHELVDNPAIALVRERFCVKIVLNQMEEYFIINQIIKSDNITTSDMQDLTIHCFYLPYELKYKLYKSYSASSYNCLQVTNDCLDGTPWKIGKVDPSFDIKYRQFDLSSGTRLDFLNTIGTTFKAVKTYDSKNRLVNFSTEDEICKYNGLNLRAEQYIDGISDDINIDNMATRLYVYGNNDLTIDSVSPIGQEYIQDFSHFLFPFEMDDKGNIISSSNYMSDALAKAIVENGKLVEQNQTSLNGYFNQISTIQKDITTINNQITDDNTNLTIANDTLKIYEQNGMDTIAIKKQIVDLTADLKTQNSKLTADNNQITTIQKQIKDLTDTLILENYLTNTNQTSLLEELKYYILEQEFTDDTIIDATDLYNEGLSQLATLNSPPVSITINLLDFLACLEESYNWDKLNIGDLINVIHPTIGIDIQAKITQIDYDFEAETITLTVSNGQRVLPDWEQMAMNSYNFNKTSKDYNNRKIDWTKTSYNFNTRNDRISDIPVDPTFDNKSTDITHVKNDDGSVTLTVNWNYPTDTTKNANNIDGFNVYLYASENNTDTVVLGSMGDQQSILNPSGDLRKITIPSVPANLYYYIGVQAYRDVDNDISASGIILSNIVTSTTCYPYQPEKSINVNGSINGVNYTVSPDPPLNPNINDIWTNTKTLVRSIYTSNGWEATVSASSSTLNGYSADTSITPNSIPIRDDTGVIPGSISGSAALLNGKTDSAFAQLDDNGKINIINIPSTVQFGTYVGDGNQQRTISLPFTPRLVKVMATTTTDISLYINSANGGYKEFISTSHIALIGMLDSSPSESFGKLSSDGFIVGVDANLYGNVMSNTYIYEAYS